jgi:hypothetical protein
MPTQMKGGSFKGRGAKAGTRVVKVKAQGSFRLSTQGIPAQGGGCRMESRGEMKDRLVG